LVTAGNEQQAQSIAHHLVDDRLAACVNIVGPIRSVYRWGDAVEDEPEFLLLIKTRASLLDRLERRVIELHSYEIPEVLAIAPSGGSAAYLGCLKRPRRNRSAPRLARLGGADSARTCFARRSTRWRPTCRASSRGRASA
jgi:periplasmic divalent cation tolerance protein